MLHEALSQRVFITTLRHFSFRYGSPLVFQLLDDCTARLKMSHPAKTLYTSNGELIQSWDDIEKGMAICVSTGHGFITSKGTGDTSFFVKILKSYSIQSSLHSPCMLNFEQWRINFNNYTPCDWLL